MCTLCVLHISFTYLLINRYTTLSVIVCCEEPTGVVIAVTRYKYLHIPLLSASPSLPFQCSQQPGHIMFLCLVHTILTCTCCSSALVLAFPFSAANNRGISCSSVWYTQYSDVLVVVRTYLWIVRSSVCSPGRHMSVVWSATDSPGGTCQLCGRLLTPPGHTYVSCVVRC